MPLSSAMLRDMARQRVSFRSSRRYSSLHARAYSSQSTDGNVLTHVNEQGEVRMVDVGSKTASRRAAIATATVKFSNSVALGQIRSNTNKKGDVLGVARIAGIMAAKRTSELIPLCHPIMISKVNLTVEALQPEASMTHGSVQIESRVECVGPTGVEMEALTAATTAALTIYDMCKAVDRDMVIENSKVVYKSGGKSGTHVCQEWLSTKDKSTLVADGLNTS